MADVLVRDLPEEVLATLDLRAAQLGISRSEYLRRRLTADATASSGPVFVEDLERFALTFADLADPEVLAQAWR